MEGLLTTVHSSYLHITYDLADRRIRDWYLPGSPLTLFAVVVVYLYTIKVAAPRFMKDRPAYNIDGIIAVYNIAQVILCSYLFIQAVTYGWGTKLRFYCEPVDTSNKPIAIEMVRYAWIIYLMKIFDLFDTVFYILRKKNTQVTFLHVFHHVQTLVAVYILVLFTPGGHSVLDASVNCFVHSVMFAYYFITNTFPEYKKNIWWKKHLTQLQLAQFCFIFLRSLPAVIRNDCGFPWFSGGMVCFANVMMFYLFSKFYIKTYWKKKHN